MQNRHSKHLIIHPKWTVKDIVLPSTGTKVVYICTCMYTLDTMSCIHNMLAQYQYVNVLHSITARIASCIDRALPYANVIGVDTMAELEGNLTNITAPISLSTALFETSTNPVSFDAGCFIGGAGVNIQ